MQTPSASACPIDKHRNSTHPRTGIGPLRFASHARELAEPVPSPWGLTAPSDLPPERHTRLQRVSPF